MNMHSHNQGRPMVLVIGGSDSAGMAGVQMDLGVVRAFGCHAATAITALTAQHSGGVLALNPVDPQAFARQLDACKPLPIQAIKIGLLATPQQVRICADFVREKRLPVVLDPVVASSSGFPLMAPGTLDAIQTELLPECLLLTPNRDEVLHLATIRIDSDLDAEIAGDLLVARGARSVLVKGGHGDGPWSRDFFAASDNRFWLASPRLAAANRRGTGCALASAVASALALGYSLMDALVIAKMAINQGCRQAYGWPDHEGPVEIRHFPDGGDDLPVLLDHWHDEPAPPPFPDCGPAPLGLYPVVDRSHWLETLLPCGVSTIQLRIKDLAGQALRNEIRTGIRLARQHNARLFINDHWQLAIELGAYGVHLGQEDLGSADVEAIRRAGLRLGISTHCHIEVARAHRYRPSYLACGPIYPTTSKAMPWIPHGIEGLAYWRRVLAHYPLVAIGGINAARLPAVHASGVDGIAMISALTCSPDPVATARDFMALTGRTTCSPRHTGLGQILSPIAEPQPG